MWLYGKTRREVLSKLDKGRETLRSGHEPLPAAASHITVGMLLDEWLDANELPGSGVRRLTAAQYRTEAKTRVRPLLGKLPVVRLDDERLKTWQDTLLKPPYNYAPRSILKARTVLSKVIALARRRKLLLSDPLELVPIPHADKPRKRAITAAEAGQFLAAIHGHQYELLFLADLLSGVRRGELLGWTWQDLDLKRGTVRIHQQLQRLPDGAGLKLVEAKTDSSIRLLPLPALLIHRLRELRETLDGDGLVFVNSRGKPLEPSRFNYEFKQLVVQAGLAPLTPHELRHSVATVLQVLGVPSLVVAQLLGHADPSVTLRWYSHDVPDAQRDAIVRLDEYVTGLQLAAEQNRMAVKMAVKPASAS